MSKKYKLPKFLEGQVEQAKYNDWLSKKSISHTRNDRRRGNSKAVNEAYKMAIHAAIIDSNGFDEYSGEPLKWNLIGTWDNEKAKLDRRKYKALHDMLPTLDHVSDGMGEPDFKICSYRTNDAKGIMSQNQFIAFCRLVVAHSERSTPVKPPS
jgi:hypothetical protein